MQDGEIFIIVKGSRGNDKVFLICVVDSLWMLFAAYFSSAVVGWTLLLCIPFVSLLSV